MTGRLSGFRYRQIIKRLKKFGFAFDRQAGGSYEIWYSEQTDKYTTISYHPGDIPEGTLRAILKHAFQQKISFKSNKFDTFMSVISKMTVFPGSSSPPGGGL